MLVATDLQRFANSNALNEIYRVLSPGGAFGMIWVYAPYSSRLGERLVLTLENEQNIEDCS